MSSTKSERQRQILQLVAERPIRTQADLKNPLLKRGMLVDPATLSRDIRQLGLVKIPDGEGGYRYAPVDGITPPSGETSEQTVGRLARSAEASKNILVIRTDPGNASALGLAIDQAEWPEVAGSLAGDDTVLLVVRERHSARKLARRIERLKR